MGDRFIGPLDDLRFAIGDLPRRLAIFDWRLAIFAASNLVHHLTQHRR